MTKQVLHHKSTVADEANPSKIKISVGLSHVRNKHKPCSDKAMLLCN